MTVAELIAELQEQPGRLDVVLGEYPIERVQLARGDCDRVIELSIDTIWGEGAYAEVPIASDSGIVGNPPGDLREDTAEKLKKYGLSIEGIEPKPCRRTKYIELKRSIPELIAQLSAWQDLKNAKLLWHAEVGYRSDEPDVEHEITWEGLNDPNETAGKLIRAYEDDQRERNKYQELHAKYGPDGSEEGE